MSNESELENEIADYKNQVTWTFFHIVLIIILYKASIKVSFRNVKIEVRIISL